MITTQDSCKYLTLPLKTLYKKYKDLLWSKYNQQHNANIHKTTFTYKTTKFKNNKFIIIYIIHFFYDKFKKKYS